LRHRLEPVSRLYEGVAKSIQGGTPFLGLGEASDVHSEVLEGPPSFQISEKKV